MSSVFDWNDLKHFLAVARTGSTLAAARQLEVNQTTSARRIAALETALGVSLFERRQSGHALTVEGQAILAAAEAVEQSALDVRHIVEARERRLSGSIRVTTTELIANVVLAPFMREFSREHPDVRVELVVEERRLDVARGEADVALRAGSRPQDLSLIARRLTDLAWAPYVGRTYAERHGVPGAPEEIDGHAVIGGEGALAALPGPRWVEAVAPGAQVICRCNTLSNQAATVKAGLGLATLPCFVGDSDPDFVRCFEKVPEIASELWLVMRGDLRGVERVRSFVEHLAAHVLSMKTLLSGEAWRAA